MGGPNSAVFMCHAPIVIPAIGGGRAGSCAATTEAMHRAATHLMELRPETVVVVSPHLPRHPEAYGWAEGSPLVSDFRDFGHPEVRSTRAPDGAAAGTLRRAAERLGLPMEGTPVSLMDHGAGVPLWFLQAAGFQGRLLLLGLPWQRNAHGNRLLGTALAEVFTTLDRRWALVASGDLSHALQPGAPAGFHPRAAAFDAELMEALRRGPLQDLQHLDPGLRQAAAEDAVDSLQVAEGALGPGAACREVLSYEAPFGVGYGVALLR